MSITDDFSLLEQFIEYLLTSIGVFGDMIYDSHIRRCLKPAVVTALSTSNT